jgi:hypothetical protein
MIFAWRSCRSRTKLHRYLLERKPRSWTEVTVVRLDLIHLSAFGFALMRLHKHSMAIAPREGTVSFLVELSYPLFF